MITSWPLNVASDSGPPLQESWEVMSPCHIPTVASPLTDEESLSSWRAVHRQPPSTRLNSLNYSQQVHLQTHLITVTKLAPSWPPSSPDNGHQPHLHTRLITASRCISQFTRSRPPSEYRTSLNHVLRMYLWVQLIVIFRRTLNCSQAPPAASPDKPCVDG